MEFRWAAAIALWTLLIGPVIGPPVHNRATTAGPATHPVMTVRAVTPSR